MDTLTHVHLSSHRLCDMLVSGRASRDAPLVPDSAHCRPAQEEYEEKLKELEDVANPVVSAAYAASGGGEGGAGDEDLGDHDEL